MDWTHRQHCRQTSHPFLLLLVLPVLLGEIALGVRGQAQPSPSTTTADDTLLRRSRQLLWSSRYTIIRSDDVDDVTRNIYYPNENGITQVGSVPTELSGLYWMDGNGLNEFIASFGGQSNWESVQDDGYECQVGTILTSLNSNESYECLGGFEVRIAGDTRTWSYADSFRGRIYAWLMRIVDTRLVFECGSGDTSTMGSIEYCQIRMGFNWLGFLFDLYFKDALFEMTLGGDGLWYRDSYVDGSAESRARYRAKRIVNGDGTINQPYWSEYVSGGTAVPSVAEGDDRETVSFVPETQLVMV